jgi:hypothetical protein
LIAASLAGNLSMEAGTTARKRPVAASFIRTGPVMTRPPTEAASNLAATAISCADHRRG